MIRTSLFLTALLSASLAFAGNANVTLSGQNGTVLVNSGKQFVSAHPGQIIAPGDRILVMKGGKATLTYPDGCVSTINSGSMVNVSAHCVLNSATAQKAPSMYAQAVGDTNERRRCRYGYANDADHNNDCCVRQRVDNDPAHDRFDCCARRDDYDANRDPNRRDDRDDRDACAVWPPAWAVFTTWAVAVCATIVCRHDDDEDEFAISTP